MQNEIIINKEKMYDHFSNIASQYRSVRTTDLEPILHIKKRIDGKSKVSIADVGCGDGRYSHELLRCLDEDSFLHCVDYNENMLKELRTYLTQHNKTNFHIIQGDAKRLPLESDSFDYIVTLNAIHHFDIQRFLIEVLRSLKDDGHLFIYTRLKNQNSRNIWGKYFPSFINMENRLYEFDELKQHIKETNMKIHSTKIFGYHRTSSLNNLVKKARSGHYSTFALYSIDYFDESLKTFEQNIRNNFDDLEEIKWQDENILFEIKK